MAADVISSETAGDVLARSRIMIQPELRRRVERLPPELRRVAGYHFGWSDIAGQPTSAAPGKSVRPALAVLSAQAVGSTGERAIPGAAAAELVHNFSLLHDDVMDEDRTRRHRPTAWTIFGRAAAVFTGDALLAAAGACLAEAPAVPAVAGKWLSQCVVDLCRGQAADLAFERRDDVGIDECCAMAVDKTGSLLGCAAGLGALLGGADTERATLFQQFGKHLGLAFQLVDDLLGIWGDPSATGKPASSDLAHRKMSLPVVAALNSRTSHGLELAGLYRCRKPWRPVELAYVMTLVERAGGRDWAQQQVAQATSQALACLKLADCRPDAAAGLTLLTNLMTRRDH